MDLIDRQAAIDILEVAINDDWEFDYAKDRMIELHVQPEIIRCKDCVHPERIHCKECYWHNDCGYEQYLGLDGFCSRAERRADGYD